MTLLPDPKGDANPAVLQEGLRGASSPPRQRGMRR